MSHTLSIRTYYADTDAGLVIHHARYIEFFERSRTEWLRQLKAGPKELKAHQLLFLVRDLHTQFLAPGRLDDLLDLHLSVLSIGNSQIKLLQEARRQEDGVPEGVLLASAILHIVCADAQTMKSTRVPDWIREQLHPVEQSS